MWKMQSTSISSKSVLGLRRTLEIQDWVLNLDPDLDMVTGAKNTNYLYVLIRVLEDARGSRLGSET